MKLSNKQKNRIEEYLTYGQVYPLSNDYETLQTILNDGEIKSSHTSLLEEVEGRYKCYVETHWEDLENGGFISGKDYAKGKLKSELLNQCRICRKKISDITLKLHFKKNKNNRNELNDTLSNLVSEIYSLERKLNYLK